MSNSRNPTAGGQDPALLAGLAAGDDEKSRLATIFWEKVWPKLAENGWSKVSIIPSKNIRTVVMN